MKVFNGCKGSLHSGLSVAVYIKLRAACHDLVCICPNGGESVWRRKMKKGQILTGMVERVDFPNKGIVVTGEEKCIVKNVLRARR